MVEDIKSIIPADVAIAHCLPSRSRTPIYSPNEKEILLTVAGLQRAYYYHYR